MANLSKKHFVWLSTDIAGMITPHMRRQFVDSIINFNDNPQFIRFKFENKMMETIVDQIADDQANEISPELYKIQDMGWRKT